MMWFGETPSGRLMVGGRNHHSVVTLSKGPNARLALGLPVLVNRASAEELEQVGIGPRTATRLSEVGPMTGVLTGILR